MLISLEHLIKKYNINFTGILHVGAHECEEIVYYEKYIAREKILWIEALPDKIEINLKKFPKLLIVNAIVSDGEELVTFNESNNGQSSSFLQLGSHKINHPDVWYVKSFTSRTQMLKNIICNYDIPYNFINLDIQGAELKALMGMEDYLSNIDYIYTEINSNYVYEGCSLVNEIDDYLGNFGFKRVETEWYSDFGWGDGFYIRMK